MSQSQRTSYRLGMRHMRPRAPVAPPMTTEAKKDQSPRWKSYISNLSDLRDLALVITALSYVTGYVMWAYNSYRNDLGFINFVDYQYVTAGLIPLMTLAACALLMYVSIRYFEIWLLLAFIFLVFTSYLGLADKQDTFDEQMTKSTVVFSAYSIFLRWCLSGCDI